MIDRTKPFQAMLHDGSFNNIDFQPARDVVSVGGAIDMARLKFLYLEKLLAEGTPQVEADCKVALVKGAVTILTDQFLVMGMDRGIVLTDKEQNKRAWEMCAKSGNAMGQRVGGDAKVDRDRDKRRVSYQANAEPLVRPTNYQEYRQNYGQIGKVAALSDDIAKQMENERKKAAMR